MKKILMLITLITSIFSCLKVLGQKEKLDSLLKILTDTSEFHQKSLVLQKLGEINTHAILPECVNCVDGYMKLAIKNNDSVLISDLYFVFGNLYYYTGSVNTCIENYMKALKIAKVVNNIGTICLSYNQIGKLYAGIIEDYKTGLLYYDSAYATIKNDTDKILISKTLYNKGSTLVDLGNFSEGFRNLYLGYQLNNNKIKQGYFEIFLSKAYTGLNKLDSAYYFTTIAIKVFETNNDINGTAEAYKAFGLIFSKKKNYIDAIIWYKKSINIFSKLDYKDDLYKIHYKLYEIYSEMHHYKDALQEHIIYSALFNEVNKEANLKVTQIEFDKKEKELIFKKEKELQHSELLRQQESGRRQKLIIIFIIAGLILTATFTVFVVQRLRITRRQKRIIEKQKTLVDQKNIQLNQANEEITVQRDEIEAQRDKLSEQNTLLFEQKKEITDSINYAKRIQTAVLPTGEYANSILGEHFILFKPKDIVSGDFYWGTRINEWLIVTVADCTGHGVPGAFMSMLGVSFLNEIVRKKEVTKAFDVLDNLRESIIEALQQKGSDLEQKDGMDIALCALNTENNLLQYAGANNPLFIVSALKEVKVLEPDKQPVGIHSKMQAFTNTEIQLNKGDILFLTSDGYEDQFGGPNNKKFKIKQLKELFMSIAEKPMDEQKNILETTFENWKGEHEQIDDVTILGIKI